MRIRRVLFSLILVSTAIACAATDLAPQLLPRSLLATQTAIPSNTGLPQPSDTPLPSFTPSPTETSIPTSTSTASPIPPTPTPIRLLNDPRNSLPTTPTWADYFDNDLNWTLYTSETASAQILDGQFIYRKIPEWSGAEWVLTTPSVADFYLEVTTRTPLRCEGTDRYGLVFGAPTTNKGYFYTITCDGLMRLYAWNGKKRTDLVEWRHEEEINIGPSQVNRLAVEKQGSDISLFINGNKVENVQDTSLPKPGRFGFVIASANTANFIVAFDDLLLWQLP